MQEESNDFIQISHFYSQPPSRLWQAWTDPSIIKKWFGSDPNGTVLEAETDVQFHGFFRVRFANSDGSEFTARGNYNEIELHKGLAFTWGWEDSPNVVELISLQFKVEKSGTLMLFEHHNIDRNTAHNYAEGWKSTFTKLEKALDELDQKI